MSAAKQFAIFKAGADIWSPDNVGSVECCIITSPCNISPSITASINLILDILTFLVLIVVFHNYGKGLREQCEFTLVANVHGKILEDKTLVYELYV